MKRKYVLKNHTRPDKEYIESFQELDVSTVYEAQKRTGLLNPTLRPLLEGSLLVGPAVTVSCQAGDNLMVHAAIEVCQPGDVLVVSTLGDFQTGMIGELIATALQKRGVKGVIIDSGVRDANMLRRMNFPVWSRTVTSRGSTKSKGGTVNAPILCEGISINPGDIILADDDGVVVIDKGNIQTVLAAAKERTEREIETRRKIAEGQLSIDFYDLRPVLEKEDVRYFDNEEDFENNLE